VSVSIKHGDVHEITSSLAEMLRPPSRMLPIEAVQRYLRTENGPYSLDLTPMMAEPLNYMASRDYRGICFIGPARGGKTMTLVLGALVYIVMCAPGDTQITQMSQDAAREFSSQGHRPHAAPLGRGRRETLAAAAR
jgi:phage terminase large subunit GpA-like protein